MDFVIFHMQTHVIISGSVQGVGYRQFVKKHALELVLTGWVKNVADGSVEAVFQGSKEAIEKMIAFCKKGPFLAEVEDISVTWEEEQQEFDSFKILHE